ncbi:MAG: aminotransferase [Gemmatimonadaceae bacterium]|nr:aminotransferase [Gemmatimonadaceae bacterium]
MHIEEFGVEQWMDAHEDHCEFNLAETCVDSLHVHELLALAGRSDTILDELRAIKLTYGAIEGSARLRTLVAGLFRRQVPENVTITHGAAGGNALVYETLVGRGDHVISLVPNYQQHYSIPEAFGGEVDFLPLREADGYLPDLDALQALLRPDTKLVVFSNPNNPTGALMDRPMLEAIVRLVAPTGAWILSDEVYRGVDHDGTGFTASIADLYDRGISTGSMSKAYSLAGLRLGWIVGPAAFLRDVTVHRHYNTISVGVLDDLFASMALQHREAILSRNRTLLRENLALLDAWVQAEPGLSYVKPRSGTTALVKYDIPIPSVELCLRLLDQTGVMFVPGSVMQMEGHLRIGYANARRNLELGLPRVSGFLRAVRATAGLLGRTP